MEKLDKLRKKIQSIDAKITKLLKERYKVVNEIGKIKRKNDLSIQNRKREDELLKYIIKSSACKKECREYLKNVFRFIYKESRKVQRRKR